MTYFHLGFFEIKNAELFFIFIKDCKTIKSATRTVIIVFVSMKCRANFTDPLILKSLFLNRLNQFAHILMAINFSHYVSQIILYA